MDEDRVTTVEIPVKLNLGCGLNHLDGWVNVDREARAHPDVLCDLAYPLAPWPWADGEVGEVRLHHVLEHIADLCHFFVQLYRVCAPGALITITVPHHRSDGFASDPTHVHAITVPMLRLYSRRACAEFAERGWPNTPLAVYLDVDFEIEDVHYEIAPAWKGLPRDTLERAIESFANVVTDVTVILRRV